MKLSPEVKEAIRSTVEESMHSAIGQRLKRNNKTLMEAVGNVVKDQFKELKAGMQPDDNDDDDHDDDTEGEEANNLKGVPKSIIRRLKAAESRAERAEKFEQEQVADKLAADAKKAVRKACATAGVTEAADVDWLEEQYENRISRDDEGVLVIGTDSVEDHFAEFFKSSQGKRFIPANDGEGSGSQTPSGKTTGVKAGDDEPSLADAFKTLMATPEP